MELLHFKKRILYPVLIFIFCIPLSVSADNDRGKREHSNGQPFKSLQQQINNLQDQIDNIQLTPGPAGPQGPAGPAGVAAPDRTAELCLLYLKLSENNLLGDLAVPDYCNAPEPVVNQIIFVTQEKYTGNLGGLAGADAICQTSASQAGLSGTFKAWLSDSSASAASRLIHHTTPYGLVDGTVVALNWADLTDETLLASISLTQNGNLADEFVWTGTHATGELVNIPGINSTCNNWTSSAAGDTGTMGYTQQSDIYWSETPPAGCAFSQSLYCVQQ